MGGEKIRHVLIAPVLQKRLCKSIFAHGFINGQIVVRLFQQYPGFFNLCDNKSCVSDIYCIPLLIGRSQRVAGRVRLCFRGRRFQPHSRGRFQCLSVRVKGKRHILAVPNGNGLLFVVTLLTDIFQPLLGKAAQVIPQFGPPQAGFGVDLLIYPGPAVLPKGQRVQRPLLMVYAEGHFRVVHGIAIYLEGVADSDHIRVNPLQMKRHHAWAGFHTQIAVFAAGDLREHFRKITIVQLRPGPSGLFR